MISSFLQESSHDQHSSSKSHYSAVDGHGSHEVRQKIGNRPGIGWGWRWRWGRKRTKLDMSYDRRQNILEVEKIMRLRKMEQQKMTSKFVTNTHTHTHTHTRWIRKLTRNVCVDSKRE